MPLSEAKIAEAVDYIVHYCGLECYAKWTDEVPQSIACAAAALAPLRTERH